MDRPGQLNAFVLKSISYNMILQFSFRIFSFVLNAYLFRSVSTALIGACNLHLALLYTTIIFLGREAFRRALPDLTTIKTEKARQELINSIWLAIPNGVVVSIGCGLLWSYVFDVPDESQVYNYRLAVIICCLACFVELTGESAFATAQMLLLAKRRVFTEAANLFISNALFVGLAVGYPHLGALAYSIARLVNATLLVASSFINLPDGCILLPSFKVGFDVAYLKLVRAYYIQSVFKQLLTEGERYLIAAFGLLTFSESGIYDLVNNLGSIIARLVFLPIEEASYIYFTNSFQRGVGIVGQQQQGVAAEAKSFFELVIKVVSLVGVTVFVYGQSYSALLLHIYGGSRLSGDIECVNLLRFFCFYIVFLALNGVTEGFFNATMSEAELKKHNYRLFFFSAVFLTCTFVFARLFHASGFIMANCVNMLVRILFSSVHVRAFFSQPPKHYYNVLLAYSPNWRLLLVYALVLIATKTSEIVLYDNNHLVLHFSFGALVFAVNLALIFQFEHRLKPYVTKYLKKIKLA